jgi:hypothetical protein
LHDPRPDDPPRWYLRAIIRQIENQLDAFAGRLNDRKGAS